jgi:flagellar basal-body rod protein FlgC
MSNFFKSMDISASALTAQRFRMDVIAENVANTNTTRTANGEPYRRRTVVLREREIPFSEHLKAGLEKTQGNGVEVASVQEDQSPFKLVYDPSHPDANEEGYVEMPNVDIAKEIIDMIAAYRAYEANVTALNAFKQIALKALEIGK